jgi:SEC-C motif domain protein
MRDISPNDACPCGSGKKYKKCCRPYHHGVPVPSPVELLRARYCAYVLRHTDYIMQTTHPESPHIEKENRWRASLDAYTMRTIYEELTILEVEDAAITYRVQYWNMVQRGSESYTTRSNFKQHEGKWYYFDDSEIESTEAEITEEEESSE